MTQTKQEKQRAYWRAWYERNKEKQSERGKAWRAANPTRCRGYDKERRRSLEYRRRKKMRWLYGITPEQKAEMFVGQGGRCAICSTDISADTKAQHLDHCHVTGAVRAILCRGCNMALGHAGDDPQRLRAMAAYLEHHQTKKSPET